MCSSVPTVIHGNKNAPFMNHTNVKSDGFCQLNANVCINKYYY